jgi:HK97 family phage portal protein
MGFFDIFKKKGLNPRNMLPPIILGQTVMGNYKNGDAINEGFADNADVYAIISLLARKAASIPFYVYEKSTSKDSKVALERYKALSRNPLNVKEALKWRAKSYDDEAIVEDNDLARILARPNPGQGQDKFFEMLYIMYWSTGEGFIWGNDGEMGGEFVEMYALPSHYMDHILDTEDIFGVKGWRLSLGNGIYLSKDNILQWKMSNPIVDNDHFNIRGFSPLQAAYRTVQMGNEAEKAGYSMMANGGSKGALSPEPVNNQVPQMTLEQADSIRGFVSRYVNGTKNKGNITVLQTPWKYLDFGLSSVDMQLIESQNLTLERLCRVYGVPVVLFSPDNMADNNYQNALRDLVTNTIVPAIASLRDELNRWLIKRNGDDRYYIDFDIQALPEMQRDMEKLVAGLAQANWLTYDEKREAMGYEPLGGNFERAYIPSGVVPIDEASLDLGIIE